MSSSWYSKRYRTPDIEIQRINNILQKQALERAQQERPSSPVQLLGVAEESLLAMHDKFKARVWPISDLTNFAFPLEPDRQTLACGADFNAGAILDDVSFNGSIINVMGVPEKADGLEDGENMHVPIDLKFNGVSDYVRIEDSEWIRIKEIMESPPSGVDGITLVFRITPITLSEDKDQYLLSKFDNNSVTYGMQIKIKPDGSVHWFVMRNGTIRKKYALTPFTLIPPPPGNYYLQNYMPENYMTVGANQVVEADYILFFQYRFSDNTMRILKGNAIDITAGDSTDLMLTPAAIAEPPSNLPDPASKITVVTSIVSGEDAGHVKADAFDNNLSTYWAHSSRAAFIIADLGVPQRVTAVEIAWQAGNTKRYYYDIYTGNQTEISSMTRVTPATILSSGTTTARVRYTFPSEKYARYIAVAGYGNQGDPTPSPPVPSWLNLVSLGATATANGNEEGNTPGNAIDANEATRWAYGGRGAWLKIDLTATYVVDQIHILWYKAEVRRYRYEIHVSTDDATYVKAYPSGGTETAQSEEEDEAGDYDRIDLPTAIAARYVKITVYGNTTNSWASIYEVKVKASAIGGTGDAQSLFAITEYDVYGYPSQTETDPFVSLYNNAPDAPNTNEYFADLYAAGPSSTFVNVYSVTQTDVERSLGQAFERYSRAQNIDASANCPFFGEKLTKVTCFAKKYGSPTGQLKAYIYSTVAATGEDLKFDFGTGKDVSTISNSAWEEITFTNTNSDYNIGINDAVSFDYYLGDADNYIVLAARSTDGIPDCHHVFYSDAWHDNADQDLSGNYYTGSVVASVSNVAVAQEIIDQSSPLYGQVLSKFVFYLRKKGSPTGTVYFRLLNAQNQLVYTLGSVNITTITASTSALTTVTVDYSSLASTQTLVGYKISVEYSGGDPDNCLRVKLFNDNNSSSSLITKDSRDIWTRNASKDLAGIFYKGGKTRIISGSPIPPTPEPYDDYSHDMFLFVAGEEDLKINKFTGIALQNFYNGRANRFRFYRRYLTDQQMTNWNTNKKSISAIAYGKIFTPMTFVKP